MRASGPGRDERHNRDVVVPRDRVAASGARRSWCPQAAPVRQARDDDVQEAAHHEADDDDVEERHLTTLRSDMPAVPLPSGGADAGSCSASAPRRRRSFEYSRSADARLAAKGSGHRRGEMLAFVETARTGERGTEVPLRHVRGSRRSPAQVRTASSSGSWIMAFMCSEAMSPRLPQRARQIGPPRVASSGSAPGRCPHPSFHGPDGFSPLREILQLRARVTFIHEQRAILCCRWSIPAPEGCISHSDSVVPHPTDPTSMRRHYDPRCERACGDGRVGLELTLARARRAPGSLREQGEAEAGQVSVASARAGSRRHEATTGLWRRVYTPPRSPRPFLPSAMSSLHQQLGDRASAKCPSSRRPGRQLDSGDRPRAGPSRDLEARAVSACCPR